MADHPHHHHDDATSISINGRSRGSSKAQLSLQKILLTVSSNQIRAPSIPHHQSPASASSSSSPSLTSSSSSVLINAPDEMMGPTVNLEKNSVGSLHFDLNLSPPPEEEQIDFSDQTHHEESQSPPVNAGDGGELRGNDNERILEADPEEEEETDHSDQTHHQDSQFPVGNAGNGGTTIHEDDNERVLEVGPEEQKEDEEEEKNKRRRRFAALLDVVKIVSGDDGRSEPMDPAELLLPPVDNRSTATSATTDHELTRNPRLRPECEEEGKGQKNAAAEMEEEVEEGPLAAEKVSAVVAEVAETAVVRTKRGRAQVLPNKYRDSFVEPITNLSSRHNRSSSSKHVPSKRRSTR